MVGKVFSSINAGSDRERVKLYKQNNSGPSVFFPWGKGEFCFPRYVNHVLTLVAAPMCSLLFIGYKLWWGFTVFAAAFTIFLETYQIAFSLGGLATEGGAALELILFIIFFVDIIINFNLAYYDKQSRIVFARRDIARNYVRCMFWVDLIGVFPFYFIALQITGEMGNESQLTQNLGLLRLFKLVRVHRVALFFSILQQSSEMSLMVLTLIRNFSAALVWTHTWACIMFFIARESAFDADNTWLGSTVSDLNGFERYITSLYWSVVTVSKRSASIWLVYLYVQLSFQHFFSAVHHSWIW